MNIVEKDTHEARTLVIGNEGNKEDFSLKMIRHMKDPLFLPPAGPAAAAVCEGGAGFDISGLTTMNAALENRTLSAEEITAMIIRLGNAILILEAHLLGDENILLSPDRIYAKPGSLELLFCPALLSEGNFEERLRPFVREIFLHADTAEPHTLKLASELMKVSLLKHYRMHDLMKVLENGAPKENRTEEREEKEERYVFTESPTAKVSRPGRKKEEDLLLPWPEEEDPEITEYKKNGIFSKIKDLARTAVSWVRGDDEPEMTEELRFEDHT